MRDPAWPRLLLLGSSRDDDQLMRDALQRLDNCGAANLLTPIQRFPADDDSGRMFYNALATWQPADSGIDAQREIRLIEAELGRDRGRSDDVAIDIDILACFADGQWCPRAHAVDKHEFDRLLVRTLLHQAGVNVIRADE